MINKIFKIFLVGIIIFISSFLIFKFSWKLFDDKSELINFSEKIQNTKEIPDSLMQIYVAVFPYHDNISTTQEIVIGYGSNLHKGAAVYYDNCLCDEIIREDLFGCYRNRNVIINRIESLRLSFGLESIVGSGGCLNYYLTREHHDLRRDIDAYPYTWKIKELNELSRNEFIEYLVIGKAPTYFNKYLNKERFDARKRVIEEKLKNASL